MKTLTLTLLACLFFSLTSFSQQNCVGQINTPLGSTIDVWDWTVEDYEMYLRPPQSLQTNFEIVRSPFFENASEQPNVAYLSEPTFKDFLPEDGWELVLKSFGEEQQGSVRPFFVLYNRFTGKMRLFFLILKNNVNPLLGESFKIPEILVEFRGALSYYINASLESASYPMASIENYKDIAIHISTLNISNNNERLWLSADIPTTYDPCTCKNNSFLLMSAQNIVDSTYTLSLTKENGNQVIAVDGILENSALENRNYNIGLNRKEIIGGNQFHKNLGSFDETAKEQLEIWYNNNSNPTIQNLIRTGLSIEEVTASNVLDVFNFLENQQQNNSVADFLLKAKSGGLSAATPEWLRGKIPYVGALNNSFGYLNIQDSPNPNLLQTDQSSKFKLSPISYNHRNFGAFSFLSPGCSQAGVNPNLIPTYDNPLGVIHLVEKPKIEQATEVTSISNGVGLSVSKNISYQLKSPIKYAINPASNLDINKIRAALYFRDGAIPSKTTHLIQEDDHTWRTPYLPLGCLENYSVFFEFDQNSFALNNLDIHDDESVKNPEVTLHLAIDFEKTFLASTYLTEVVEAGYSFSETPINSFSNIQEVGKISNLSEFNNNPFFAWNEILVIDENMMIENVPTCGEVLPVSNNFLEDFCTNQNKYNPKYKISYNYPPDEEMEEKWEVRLFPNPVLSSTTIEFRLNNDEEISLNLYNFLGKRIETFYSQVKLEKGNYRLQIDMSHLPIGSYILEIKTETKNKVVKFLKH